MNWFKAGSFQRELAPKHVRHFCPTEALDRLEDIDLEGLKTAGKTVILLDVDNTLLPWRSREIPQSTHDWLAKAKALGFRFCILSNTRNPERLHALSQEMDVDYVRDKFKPSTKMYEIALERLKVNPEEAVMVGDQLLTDILGANRANIDAIWIRPMGKREFVGTRLVSRNVERIVGRLLYKYFQAGEDAIVHDPEKPGFFEHNTVRQFAKFFVVGGSSTVVDVGLHFFLMFFFKPGGREFGTTLGESLVRNVPGLFGWAAGSESNAAVPVLKVITASIAILNSFVWNRLWTFGIRGREERGAQFKKFVVVSVIGLLLNTAFTTLLNSVIPGHRKWSLAAATAVATIIVAVWNFSGQKFWAFRQKGQLSEANGPDPSETKT